MGTKRMHRMLAEAAVEIVREVMEGGRVADRAVARALALHPKWGRRDRAFVAETVYETVRWRRQLEVLAGVAGEDGGGSGSGREGDDSAGGVRAADLCAVWWTRQGYDWPAEAPWPKIPAEKLAERSALLERMPRAVRQSVSDELDLLGVAELGERRWEAELAALNRPAPVVLRVNPQRGTVASVAAELAAAGILTETVPGCPLGLQVAEGRALPPALRQGSRFEIQDAGSQQVAGFCQVEPGMQVVDACAGAGGKTLHLAALMGNRGGLTALDVEEWKLERLRARAGRAGVKVTTALPEPDFLAGLRGRADRVLADAPCSGSGTLRRQAELKYRITAEGLASLHGTQRAVLEAYAPLVKPGGRLIYATCSVFPSENQEQAAWFSSQHPEFRLEAEKTVSPAETGWDGFYMARWART